MVPDVSFTTLVTVPVCKIEYVGPGIEEIIPVLRRITLERSELAEIEQNTSNRITISIKKK
jgi:hypothetical protein